jgi:hypothetical protein
MKLANLGVVIALALWVLPQGAAAQCEGGNTLAGRYLPDGTYAPGGCGYTNPTTPGQMYPSGAQPVPSTNPAAGLSALPGQRVATGLLPATTGTISVNGVTVPSSLVLPVTGVAASGVVLPGQGAAPGGSAYGYSLPAAPAASAEPASPTAPPSEGAPPPPGRGGPSFIGEEAGDSGTDAPED